MSTTYVIRVGCDDKLGRDCAGQIEVEGTSPRDFDYIGTTLFQQGWQRGFAPREGVDNPTLDDYVAVDVCPACAERWAAVRLRAGSFTCPECGRVTHNPNDVVAGWCAACHGVTARPA